MAVALLGSVRGADDDGRGDDVRERLTAKVLPILQQYCWDCHSGEEAEADLDLTRLDPARDGDRRDDWDSVGLQRILEMVRFGAMPPADAEQPPDGERRELVDALDEVLLSIACGDKAAPPGTTVRRLNRAEYSNSIRDLFSMDLRPGADFPSDEVGAGFDNNAEVLSKWPSCLPNHRFIRAARTGSTGMPALFPSTPHKPR